MRMPSYRRHSSGQARVTINGKDRLLGPYGSDSSKAEYERLIADFLRSKSKRKPKRRSETIGDCVALFLDHCKEYYRHSNEYQNFRAGLRDLLDYADVSISRFGPAMYKEIRETLMARDGVTRVYVNRRMQKIRTWAKWCVGEELIDANVHVALQCIAPLKQGRTLLSETEKVLPVDDATIAATIKHMPPVLADMVRLHRLLGCRPGEICAITPGMVDRSHSVWEIRLDHHKTAHRGKQRIIYVGPRAQEILRPYLRRGENDHCFSPREAQEQRREQAEAERTTPMNQGNRRGYSKRSRSGRRERYLSVRYTAGTYGRAIRYACLQAFPAPKDLSKLERAEWQRKHSWSPNQIRHATATEIRSKAGLEAASVILGHSEVSVTQIYAERDRRLAIETAKKLG